MAFEAKDTTAGCFAPIHLTKFGADIRVLDGRFDQYYRQVVEVNYKHSIVKNSEGRCTHCSQWLTVQDHPRLRSAQKMTKKIHKLLSKSSKQRLSKYQSFAVNKYLNSSQQLTVKCQGCGHMNRAELLTNNARLQIKQQLLNNVSTEPQPEANEANSGKKKRKKKKKKRESSEATSSHVVISKPKQKHKDESLSPVVRVPTLHNKFHTAAVTQVSVGSTSPLLVKNSKSKKNSIATSQVKNPKKMKRHELQALLKSDSSISTTKSLSLTDFLSSL